MAATKKYPTRVILLGEARSGKSSLFYRIKHKQYRGSSRGTDVTTDGYPLSGGHAVQSRGYDFCTRQIIISPETHVNMTIMDSIYSQERGQSLSAHFYRRIQAVILVCSVDNEYSLLRLPFWIEEARLYIKDQRTVYVVVCTKCDIQDKDREITPEMLQAFSSHHELPVYEVSAKTGDGVNEMLRNIALRVVEQPQKGGTGRSGASSRNNESAPLLVESTEQENESHFVTTHDVSGNCCCTIL